MDLLRIASRIGTTRTAGPILDILRSQADMDSVFEELMGAVCGSGSYKPEDITRAIAICCKAIEKVFGSDISQEVRSAIREYKYPDLSILVMHEVLHKAVDPEFSLSDFIKSGRDFETQTSRSPVEAVIDEMIIGYIERGKFEDYDNAFVLLEEKNKYDSVKELLEDMEKPMSSPEKTKICQEAVKKFRHLHPEAANSDKPLADNRRDFNPDAVADRYTGKGRAYMMELQDMVAERLPRLADSIGSDVELKIKKLVNLVRLYTNHIKSAAR